MRKRSSQLLLLVFAGLGILLSSCDRQEPEGLRGYAENRGLLVGGALRLYPDTLADPRYLSTFAREFSIVVPEHVMKFENTNPAQGVYTFDQGDFVVHFAQEHQMKVRAHALAWHDANPSWVDPSKLTSQQMSDALQTHITQVAGHFRGQVLSWDVVNEAFDDQGNIQEAGPWPWIDHEGGRNLAHGDYIRDAFKWARAADPNALLFYNDFGAEEVNTKSDAIYKFAQELLADGVPLQGIGFQMHVGVDQEIDEDSLLENFQRFADLGLVVNVTEMDVAIPKLTDPDDLSDALAKQADQYSKVMRVCLETSSCQAFLTWGLTDKYSWIDETGGGTAPLLLDSDYQPKPAYTVVQQLLIRGP